MPRAAITGIGAIAPFATGWPAILEAIAQARDVLEPWNPTLAPPFEGARLGIVKTFPKERYFTERQLRLMDKAMGLNAVAAAFALEDAGLLKDDQDIPGRDEFATVLGSAQGEAASLFRFGSPLFQSRASGVNPAHFPMIARNVACGQIAIRFGLRGWSTMIASGDAAGAHAIARAADLVTSGRARAVLVGAYEVLSHLSLHQWKRRRALTGARPDQLSEVSNEWVPSEGACYFIVESADQAHARGRQPYAMLERCEHGYSQGARGQGWPALIDRYVGRHDSSDALSGAYHVSAVSPTDGGAGHADASAQFMNAVAQGCRTEKTLRTRPIFGETRSVNAMFAVAMAAQHLANVGAGTALASTLTTSGAYALCSLSAT
jgi:3-oxoacyl-[acyl-carrier-protein] synthase II/nodulation protein E